MSRLDQFESVFKSAAKATFTFEPVSINRVLILTDLEADAAAVYARRVRDFLQEIGASEALAWEVVVGTRCRSIGDMLELVEGFEPDLVCAYRNLHSGAWRWPHSLSDHIEVLTQATEVPVLLLPRPGQETGWEDATGAPFTVMAMTDHLAGDDQLVEYGAAFAGDRGRLVLTHVENEHVFDRYMDVISKLPRLPTDVAREDIAAQLLKEPRDYIERARAGLQEAGVALTVEAVVQMGHHLTTCQELIAANKVDLLVIHTKDHGQLAMQGLSYQLAVALRDIPILMI